MKTICMICDNFGSKNQCVDCDNYFFNSIYSSIKQVKDNYVPTLAMLLNKHLDQDCGFLQRCLIDGRRQGVML